MRPLVGITAWRRRLDTFYGPDTLQTLSVHYTDAIVAAGMTPLIFPSSLEPAEAGRLVSTVDGVLLSGGSDVDPAMYRAENTHSLDSHPEVDAFEVAVVGAARAQGKPLLAICRGLQLLNVALGGTLSQEVTSAGGVHDVITRDHDLMSSRRHVVTLEEGSILGDTYGSSEAKVNTLHHQGVDRLADGLIVEGRTDDGLIEAARCDGDWWALGVQWHPERMDGDHQALFRAFKEAIAQANPR
ncbi:MAG TPA: gamma-glutamyl-gamma-aminobutyrate hydrolase family protein [Acidimicrobiia bacterium]